MKKPRKPIRATAPMLVSRWLHNIDMELRERMAVTAFSAGYATTQHYDTLLGMMNLLLIAGSKRPEMQVYAENRVKPSLHKIQQRYLNTGKLGVSAAELKVLREMVDHSKAFWNGQSVGFFNDCVRELNAYYAELAEKRKTA